jgi:hypothetical protein
MQAAFRRARVTRPGRPWRRSSLLSASRHARPCSTTRRAGPGPEPCGSPAWRMRGWMPPRRRRPWWSAPSWAASARSRPMAAQATRAGQARRMRERPRAVDVGGRGEGATPGGMPSVGRSRPPRGAWPRPCRGRGVGAGQLAAALGPDRTTVDRHAPGRGLGSGAHHPDRGDMVDPAPHGGGAPVVRAAARGGAASAPGGGPRFPPRHAPAGEEAQRLDDLDRRQGRSSGAERSAPDPADDPPPPPTPLPPTPCPPPGAEGTGNGREFGPMPKGRRSGQGPGNRP